MLKIISTEQVRLGMFIHKLKGAWIDHPFWNKAFRLEDPADLKKLQASAVKEVVIDTLKGLDVVISNLPLVPTSTAETPSQNKPTPKPTRVLAAEEQENAKRVIKSSKKAVASMFH